jgi:hypothetical protein
MNPSARLPFLALSLMALAPHNGSGAPPAADRAAVVELFTSQGCSSCPPADRLLSKLSKDPRFQGRVVPLSFHVDYWNGPNGIGWQDPFSSARWSDRQKQYAGRVFHSNRIYTPQVVVNGRSECVGNSEEQVLARIADALAAEPAAQLTLAVDPPAADGRLRVKVGAKVARAVSSGNLDLWVAVTESGLATEVKAGENASRLLRNDRVVRRLEKALTLPAAAGSEKTGEVVLGIDKRWKPDALGVAAFLQDPATLAIVGAASREVGR